jgi:hypothetical protein
MPDGTIRGSKSPDKWEHAPNWPPDLFAVAATIVDMSGVYSDRRYGGGISPPGFFDKKYVSKIRKYAKEWMDSPLSPPNRVEKLWSVLIKNGAKPLWDSKKWQDAAIELLAISDETSVGIGLDSSEVTSIFSEVYSVMYVDAHTPGKIDSTILNTVCIGVSPDVACVQPKTVTSQVGCSLNSLSHHLALLPARTKVKTYWSILAASGVASNAPLNLLLIPFPYRIDGDAFVPGDQIDDEGGGEWGSRSSHFTVNQSWLPKHRSDQKIAKFIKDLIVQAQKQVGIVHGVVLPELALNKEIAKKVANRLRGTVGLEVFITGILSANESGCSRNEAYTCVFLPEEKQFLEFNQSKHHRWKLDEHQIKKYHLGHVLNPDHKWWENIDICERKVIFTVFRQGASMAVLVCEDLARVDPVQPVLRAIGPNLVIALLMDGPQKEARWSGRYATSLADDPGSSVLTFTSVGMINRSLYPSDTGLNKAVALWKDPKGGIRELTLKSGDLGLVLNLNCRSEENWTLDGRSDSKQTQLLSIGGIYPVALKDVPSWLK